MSVANAAVLFADRKGEEIAPLNQFYPPALLPIAGKSPLEFWLEILCDVGVTEVYLFTSHLTSNIKEAIPNGDHWGINLTYLSSKGEENPSDLVTRYGSTLPERFLTTRADVLPMWNEHGVLRNVQTIEKHDESLARLKWQTLKTLIEADARSLSKTKHLPIAAAQILSGAYPKLLPRGLRAEDGKWVATPNFTKSRADMYDGILYVGRDTHVDREISMTDSVIVEHGSFIDRSAVLKDAYILPGSYVGQNVTIESAIVCGSLLIDLKNDTAQQIGDPAIISQINPAGALVRTTTRERLVAGLYMILTAPIALPLALLTKKSGKTLTDRNTHMSNRGSRIYPIEFEKIAFNSRIEWVRRWPAFLHVLDGDLKLFGTEIEDPNETLSSPVELPLCQGMITPRTMFKGREMDDFEVQLWGMEMANEHLGFFKMLGRMIKLSLNNLVGRENKMESV
jgi:hypothetical protein